MQLLEPQLCPSLYWKLKGRCYHLLSSSMCPAVLWSSSNLGACYLYLDCAIIAAITVVTVIWVLVDSTDSGLLTCKELVCQILDFEPRGHLIFLVISEVKNISITLSYFIQLLSPRVPSCGTICEHSGSSVVLLSSFTCFCKEMWQPQLPWCTGSRLIVF